MPELELDVYGGSPEDVDQFRRSNDVPDNVHMMGSRRSSEIPRGSYLGYVSCSESEMYANAMVEACATGIIPVVSDVDYGHRQYLREIGCGTGFCDADGLVRKARLVASWDLDERKRWSRRVLAWARKFSRDSVDEVILEDLRRASQSKGRP